ncbi:MAG TPA: aminoglycoside phosphotransferase family protein [Gallionella sp.]|nr:aminoglycoside phosphotransferase family protein [Gallionella sp.]
MYLVDDVEQLLLSHGLLSDRSILFGDYEATTINRRNRNLIVTTLHEGDYLIKQSDGTNEDSLNSLRTEIEFYQAATKISSGLSALIPECHVAQQTPPLLVIEYYKSYIPLWKHYKNLTGNKLPLTVIHKVGELLANTHSELSRLDDRERQLFGFLHEDLPFGMRVNKPHTKILSYIKQGGYQLIEKLQSDKEAMLAWDRLSDSWQINSIIHGDVKLDNFIVKTLDGNDHQELESIRIVDWEMAQSGDYLWDVAGVFNDLVFWWAISMPDNSSIKEMVENARFPISEIKEGTGSFLQGYAEIRGRGYVDTQSILDKLVGYSGIRIIQTSYEIASKFDAIPNIAMILFNVGTGILRNPQAAFSDLFGLSAGSAS